MFFVPRTDFKPFLATTSFPVLITELAAIIGQYVLAFRKGEAGFEPIVLTDIGFGRNLYVRRDGKWMSRYQPLCLQGYPFRLELSEQGKQCLHLAKEHLVSASTPEGHPIFDQDGGYTETVQKYFSILEKMEVAHQRTLRACHILEQEGLFAEWDLKIRMQQDTDPVGIPGLYKIDPERLLSLSGQKLAYLKDNGILTFALSQPMSMKHVSILMERASYLMRQEAGERKVTRPSGPKPSFDLSDDEMISF